jgi:hypothetical protein
MTPESAVTIVGIRRYEKKNQTNAGRVSQDTSLLPRNFCQFSQATGSQASGGFFSS